MTTQQLRILIAGIIAVISLIGVILLAVLVTSVPPLLEVFATGSLFYLFGVVTNGSGLGGNKPQGGGQ